MVRALLGSLLGVALLLGAGSVAHAVPVDVTYSIDGTLRFDYGFGEGGTTDIRSGSATIRYLGASLPTTAPGALVGAVQLRTLTMTMRAPTLQLYGYIPLRGTFTLAVSGQPVGSKPTIGAPLEFPIQITGGGLLAGRGPSTPYSPGSFYNAFVRISLIENFAAANANPTAGTGITWQFSLPQPGSARSRGLTSGTMQFREVSRTIVPEPGSLSMLWLGLVGLGGWRVHRRRVRRAA